MTDPITAPICGVCGGPDDVKWCRLVRIDDGAIADTPELVCSTCRQTAPHSPVGLHCQPLTPDELLKFSRLEEPS